MFFLFYTAYNKVENWPTALKTLGAVSAVTFDVYKNVVVFHRGDRVWGSSTFDQTNVFIQKELGPIKENTIITFDRETGSLRTEWGENLFYLPHGLHINGDYYYVTDVGECGKSVWKFKLGLLMPTQSVLRQPFIKFSVSTWKNPQKSRNLFSVKSLILEQAQNSASQRLSCHWKMETFL